MHSDPEMEKTGINSIFLVLNYFLTQLKDRVKIDELGNDLVFGAKSIFFF